MSGIRVLVVEDEVLIAETIKIYLEERGHKVSDIAISYEEAISNIENNEPDLVLLDIRLYGQRSGIDVANYLNQRDKKLPFVFLTSQFDKRILENAMTSNPLGYLAKPIQKESLWTTIELAHNNMAISRSKEKKILFHDGNNTYSVFGSDIAYIQSDHVYIHIHRRESEKIIIRQSLSQIMKVLDPSLFIQCHRGYVINMLHVQQYDGSHIEINEDLIPISRSRKTEVIQKIKEAQAQ